jgi:DNA-binding NtrC family response regulator
MEKATKIKEKVLVIDDDYFVCQMISCSLEKENMLIDFENNVSDGVKRVLAERYEIIIVDVHMPGIDGVSLLPILKEIAPSSKVILTSGDSLMNLMEYHTNANIENFIQKPFDKEKLLKAIGEAEI